MGSNIFIDGEVKFYTGAEPETVLESLRDFARNRVCHAAATSPTFVDTISNIVTMSSDSFAAVPTEKRVCLDRDCGADVHVKITGNRRVQVWREELPEPKRLLTDFERGRNAAIEALMGAIDKDLESDYGAFTHKSGDEENPFGLDQVCVADLRKVAKAICGQSSRSNGWAWYDDLIDGEVTDPMEF